MANVTPPRMEIVVENSTVSTDSPERKELLWEQREEDLITKWRAYCLTQSASHGVRARQLKHKFNMASIPAIMLPVILSGFSSLLQPYPYITSSAMVVTATCTGLSAFFDFGSKSQKHFNSEGAYADLSLALESEMCKPKRHRTACDVFLEKTRSSISRLDQNAPPV